MDRENVLSVDWDYFINASLDRRMTYFPDGGNEEIGKKYHEILWATNYAEAIARDKDIRTIGLYRGYNKLRQFIQRMPNKTEIFISDSHKYAYNYFKQSGQELNVVNIDFHHDVYDDITELTCGNWLLKLIQEGIAKDVLWVRHADSDIKCAKQLKSIAMTTDIDKALKYAYNKVFICRSGTWSPPHLDLKFRDLCGAGMSKNVIVHKSDLLTWDRYSEIESSIEQLATKMKALIHGKDSSWKNN